MEDDEVEAAIALTSRAPDLVRATVGFPFSSCSRSKTAVTHSASSEVDSSTVTSSTSCSSRQIGSPLRRPSGAFLHVDVTSNKALCLVREEMAHRHARGHEGFVAMEIMSPSSARRCPRTSREPGSEIVATTSPSRIMVPSRTKRPAAAFAGPEPAGAGGQQAEPAGRPSGIIFRSEAH